MYLYKYLSISIIIRWCKQNYWTEMQILGPMKISVNSGNIEPIEKDEMAAVWVSWRQDSSSALWAMALRSCMQQWKCLMQYGRASERGRLSSGWNDEEISLLNV